MVEKYKVAILCKHGPLAGFRCWVRGEWRGSAYVDDPRVPVRHHRIGLRQPFAHKLVRDAEAGVLIPVVRAHDKAGMQTDESNVVLLAKLSRRGLLKCFGQPIPLLARAHPLNL